MKNWITTTLTVLTVLTCGFGVMQPRAEAGVACRPAHQPSISSGTHLDPTQASPSPITDDPYALLDRDDSDTSVGLIDAGRDSYETERDDPSGASVPLHTRPLKPLATNPTRTAPHSNAVNTNLHLPPAVPSADP
ncbi:MAG: hypothetical protein GC164_14745 [Phycisphaera sp.]|nr:hypothetical protein [Phycisphaera sp.]